MDGKKILITGATGYLGARMCLHLASCGYKVTALCYPELPEKEWSSRLYDTVVGDVRDTGLLEKLSEKKYDVLIHLVSLDHHQSTGDPVFVSSVNITPVWDLLNTFSKSGLNQFIYFSTVHVLGQLPPQIIDETYSLSPLSPYALTHSIGEQICNYYNRISDTKCTVVRLSNSYGAPLFPNNNCWWLVINDLCRMAYKQRKIILHSDGTPMRDFIHGNDVVEAIHRIIEAPENMKSEIFNICSGETLTILELAQLIQEIYNSRYMEKIEIEYKRGKNNDSKVLDRYRLDNSKLCSLGFKFRWDLNKGINDLFDYLEKHSL